MKQTEVRQNGDGVEKEKPGRKNRVKGSISSVIFTAVMGALLFVPAGTVEWPVAWVLLVIYFVSQGVYNYIISPDLIKERGRRHKDAKLWDRYLVATISLTGFATMIVAGLDHRFGWTGPLSLLVQVLALVLVILSTALVIWAASTNTFFSAEIRIQSDRGHSVISGGPYRYVRHPGYAGWIGYMLSLPWVLGSIPALVPALLAVGLDILRTYLEDRTLQAELPGYRDYTARVRYRLVPGVW
jgi:protein-S-isoprenylcysteine O-methyltransferase Ste14